MTTHISLRDAGVYFARTGPLATALRAAALKGLFSAALRAKSDLVTKEIPSADPRPIDRGIYRAGWQVAKLPTGATIYNPVPHARMVENGVPAGNVVASNKMHAALAEWVTRKLGIGPMAVAMRVAGAIIFRMKQRGIFARGKGLRIFETYAKSKLPARIKEECTKELRKVANK